MFRKLVPGLIVGSICLAVQTSHAALVVSGGGLTLVQQGGTFAPSNLSAGKVAFGSGQLFGNGPKHDIDNANDLQYGNERSWIGGGQQVPPGVAPGTFLGINLGAMTSVQSIAFGRDNLAQFNDRHLGLYTLQFTQVASPDGTTSATGNAATGWQNIGTLDYQSAGGTSFGAPSLRHAYNFNPVNATGVRLVVGNVDAAIDEIELYSAAQTLLVTPSLTLVGAPGPGGQTNAPFNLALAPGATAFAKDLIGNGAFASHTIPNLNDGLYGNADSWIGNSSPTFAGVNLNGTFLVDRVAFGRDNGGELTAFADRAAGIYRLQGTLAVAPNAATLDASWFDIGITSIDPGDPTRALRHLYQFSPVNVTGLRLVLVNGSIAIDEFEVFAFIPEPATMSLLALGALAMGRRRRRNEVGPN